MVHKGENYSVKMQKYYFCNGTVFYTQATKVNGVWTVGNFTTLRAPLMTIQNTQYLYTPKKMGVITRRLSKKPWSKKKNQ